MEYAHHQLILNPPHRSSQSATYVVPLHPAFASYYHANSQNQIHYSSYTRYPNGMRRGVVENSVDTYLYSLRSDPGTQTMKHSIPSHVLPSKHSPLRYVHRDPIKQSDKLEVFPLRFYPHPSAFPQS